MNNTSYNLKSPTLFLDKMRNDNEYYNESAPYFLDIKRLVKNVFKNVILLDCSRALERHISGSIEYLAEDGVFKISCNDNHSENRKRFTLAHELGHYFMHRDLLKSGTHVRDNVMYRSNISGKYEAQANSFAAQLLMPYERIEQYKAEHRSNGLYVDKIAEAFGVSEVAISIRLGMPA